MSNQPGSTLSVQSRCWCGGPFRLLKVVESARLNCCVTWKCCMLLHLGNLGWCASALCERSVVPSVWMCPWMKLLANLFLSTLRSCRLLRIFARPVAFKFRLTFQEFWTLSAKALNLVLRLRMSLLKESVPRLYAWRHDRSWTPWAYQGQHPLHSCEGLSFSLLPS